MSGLQVSQVPEPVASFISYLSKHPNERISDLVAPHKDYESCLRKLYAQDPQNSILQDGLVNCVPVFAGNESEVKTRARSLADESPEEKEKYIMPLSDQARRANGSPAIVASLKEFQDNFSIFSEGSMSDMDWNNVAVCGSAVTTSLLPVPAEWNGSKRLKRKYYHEHLAPASDVDLFLYGLDEDSAIEKMKLIEEKITGALLHETTTIRTKNAITIASKYPTRHVQIVLRLYDSISQILAGFDVDCSCVAYTGDQVYASPRALGALITQINEVDLSRRSPSYENRLSKYSHRGFEVYWSQLDRTKIDPTIFERSFGRTLGLARLLVLEKFPKSTDRDSYMRQRREERARPPKRVAFDRRKLTGNIKDAEEDDVADWLAEEEISSYTTVVIPYGPKYHPQKLNKLLYTRDLLLNAEWNKSAHRDVVLHRHPCFIGDMIDVIQDCCGCCPQPITEEEREVAEQDAKRFVSGKTEFLKDDPGRQEIGSFNPITADDWTDMAYVGNTTRLCQAIIDEDVELVDKWCQVEGNDVNCRDHTGRTPLHLAAMTSSPGVVECLIKHGARLIARLIDGKTALHIAAARGHIGIVKAIMAKSAANQEEQDARDALKKATKSGANSGDHSPGNSGNEDELDGEHSETDSLNEFRSDSDADSNDGHDSMTVGSFVKLPSVRKANAEDTPEENPEDPDIVDIELVAWDYPVTPLHLATLNGHDDMIKLLVEDYGADVLNPVKLMDADSLPKAALLTPVLAQILPPDQAMRIVTTLLKLGASTAQGDLQGLSLLHYVCATQLSGLLDTIFEHDEPSAKQALNYAFIERWMDETKSPVTLALKYSNDKMLSRLFDLGASPTIEYDIWIKSAVQTHDWLKNGAPERNLDWFKGHVEQPLFVAINHERPNTIETLLKHGADASALTSTSYRIINDGRHDTWNGNTALDLVRNQLKKLRAWDGEYCYIQELPEIKETQFYTEGLKENSYKHFYASQSVIATKRRDEITRKSNQERLDIAKHTGPGVKEKRAKIANLITAYEEAERVLVEANAKTFRELYPNLNQERPPIMYYFDRKRPTPEFSVKFSFNIADLNEVTRKSYLSLYEAVWNNDTETVMKMTLDYWLDDKGVKSSPLKISVKDLHGFSPFSIAIFRRNFDLANMILEIALAQYQPKDAQHRRWEIVDTDSDSYFDSDTDLESDSDCGCGRGLNGKRQTGELKLRSRRADEEFTKNIGTVSGMVQSNDTPMDMITWEYETDWFSTGEMPAQSSQSSLLEWAVKSNDMELFKYLLTIIGKYGTTRAINSDEYEYYRCPSKAFALAIKDGRVEMLKELIKNLGAGIPFESLMEKNNIEVHPSSGYYQGLSIKGKKRSDWINNQRGISSMKISASPPPRLLSALLGSLEALKWFSTDEPLHYYRVFGRAHAKDKVVKALEASDIGFSKFVSKWLQDSANSVLHAALLSTEEERNSQILLVKHLVNTKPQLLEVGLETGWTPLHIAVHQKWIEAVKLLLHAGANPRSRDREGANIVHNTIVGLVRNSTSPQEGLVEKAGKIFELFDPNDIKEMCLEKTSAEPGALTPLAWWLSRFQKAAETVDIIKLLHKYTGGADMDLISGTGDLPLHMAVRSSQAAVVAILLELRPDLLYRENSSGRTPIELASDIYLMDMMLNPPLQSRCPENETIQQQAVEFAPSSKSSVLRSPAETKEVCQQWSRKSPQKRKLVSLPEANEVARRLKSKREDIKPPQDQDQTTQQSKLTGDYVLDLIQGLRRFKEEAILGGAAPRRMLAYRYD